MRFFGRIDPDRFHLGQADEQAALAHRAAGNIVLAAAHRNDQSIACQLDGSITRPRPGSGSPPRPAIDHGIPDGAAFSS
jgi:hypothetical protein